MQQLFTSAVHEAQYYFAVYISNIWYIKKERNKSDWYEEKKIKGISGDNEDYDIESNNDMMLTLLMIVKIAIMRLMKIATLIMKI